MKKLITKDFIERAKKIHGNKYNYNNSIYKNSRTKVCIICPDHGEFWQLPLAHLRGQNCPKCGRLNQKLKNTISNEKLLLRFRELYGDIYDYDFSECNGSSRNVKIFCKIHKYWFIQKVSHHLNGHKCKLCSRGGGNKYTTNEFIIRAKEVHGNVYSYDKVQYIDKETPVEIICKKHGSFWQKPHNHINGCGCQTCNSTKTQLKLFNLLKTHFPKEKWLYEYQTEWLGLQKFDIYNKEHNLAIEYNGEQHYFPIDVFGGEKGYELTIKRDKLKLQKCKNNNCTLYIVKYNEFDDKKIIDDISQLLTKI